MRSQKLQSETTGADKDNKSLYKTIGMNPILAAIFGGWYILWRLKRNIKKISRIYKV